MTTGQHRNNARVRLGTSIYQVVVLGGRNAWAMVYLGIWAYPSYWFGLNQSRVQEWLGFELVSLPVLWPNIINIV